MGKLNLTANTNPVDKLQERMIVNTIEGDPQGDLFAQKVAEDIAQEGTSAPVPNVASEQTLRQAIENFSPEDAANALDQTVTYDGLDSTFATDRFEVRDVRSRPDAFDNPVTRDEYIRKTPERDENGNLIMKPKIFTNVPSNSEVYTDGGIESRATKMSALMQDGLLGIGISGHGTPAYASVKAGKTGPELSNDISQYSEGDLLSAISRSGEDTVVTNSSGFKVPNELYTDIASLVVENSMFNLLGNESIQEKNALEQAMGEESLLQKGEIINKSPYKVTQTTGNNAIGQDIHLEYIRASNALLKAQGVPENSDRYKEPRRIETREAETLGAAFKHLWAETNPELVERYEGDDNQTAYRLSPQGEAVMELGSFERKKFFPRQLVRPLKVKDIDRMSNTDVGRNVAKLVSGRKTGQKMGMMMKEAIQNLSNVPQVVDKQRFKILMATTLGVLATDNTQSWESEINGIGSSSMDRFNASRAMQDRRFAADPSLRLKEKSYNPQANMDMKRNKLANEIRAMAQDHDSANYLSWNIQGYQGRLTPQQSHYNPTTSKQVRFVTRNAVPVNVKIGSRQEKNVRQMFAMLLIPKTNNAEGTAVLNQAGDTYLPDQRDFLLTQKSNELYEYGARLTSLMAITDTDYDRIIEAITNGVPLTDPNFPKVNGFNLDPEADSTLINLITKQGDDATIYMDALIEFKKYMDFKNGVTSVPFTTYLNAYIDGKTNGPASNAMLLGNSDTAFLTGVVRTQGISTLDDGDMRDRLIGLASDSIQEGWKLDPEYVQSMDNIAMEVYANRDLAKYTIMTFGYGKEIESYGDYIQEVIELLKQKNIREAQEAGIEGLTQFEMDLNNVTNSYKKAEGSTGLPELANALNSRYAKSIKEVLGDEALEARSIMRAIAAKHAMMNEPFIITGPSGMQIHIGGEASTGYDNADKSSYRISPTSLPQDQFKTITIASYNKELTAAASKSRDGKQTPGELAYGGSAVAPIQAIDAAVVMMTASGESFKKLKVASGGNPYIYTIYDAFKMDANGYDVMLEEVNRNWEKATLNWSYLEQAKISLEEATQRFNKKMMRNSDEVTDNEAVYMKHMLKVTIDPITSKRQMKNIVSRMPKFLNKDDTNTRDISNEIRSILNAVDYDVLNPPKKPNVKQLKTFVKLMDSYFNSYQEPQGTLMTRLNKMIKETNDNKLKLRKLLSEKSYTLPNGTKVSLQYYGH